MNKFKIFNIIEFLLFFIITFFIIFLCSAHCQQHPFTDRYELRFWKLTHDDHKDLIFNQIIEKYANLNFITIYDTINPPYEIPYQNIPYDTIFFKPTHWPRPDSTLWYGDTLKLNCEQINLEDGDYAITAHDVWVGSFIIDSIYYQDTTLYGCCTNAYYIRALSPTLIKNINLVNEEIRTDLKQNYPNPFNPSTVIGFSLKKRSKVNISIYNTLGQVVKVLIDEEVNPGYHEILFKPENLASGMYIYRMDTENFRKVKRMFYIK